MPTSQFALGDKGEGLPLVECQIRRQRGVESKQLFLALVECSTDAVGKGKLATKLCLEIDEQALAP